MRIRSTKPEFWRSKTIATLDWGVRLVLKGLESYVDDNGVGKDDIALIAADVFPRDLSASPPETLARLSEAISALSDKGLIARYEVDGEELLYIDRWKELQRIDKPAKGRFRRPDGTLEYSEDVSRESYRKPREDVARAPEVLAPVTGEQGNRGTGEQVGPRKRATQRTDDWKPDDKHRLLAEQLELSLDRELEQFTDYHDSKGSTFKDWDAAFRTWLRNAAKWGQSKRNPYSKQQETDDLFGAALERARVRDQNDQQELTT